MSAVDAPAFKIGIDGGGTKTEFILTDETGTIVARRLAPGCSPSLLEAAAVHAIITENLQALTATIPAGARLAHLVLCMAGSPLFWRELGAKLTGYGELHLYTDSQPVLELATGGEPGLVMHSGTGSFVAARGTDGVTHFAGGLGWRFGDPGSAYDLGRRVIARTILELQGWAEPSRLGRTICQETGLRDALALTRHFYSQTTANTALAAFAPHVTTAAETDDPVAVNLITQSVTELGHVARAVINRLFPSVEKIPLGLSGAILHTATARTVLTQTLGPRCNLKLITDPPSEGLRRMLARL